MRIGPALKRMHEKEKEKLIDEKAQISIERFPAGTYIAVIYQDGKMFRKQFVVL